MAATVLGMGTVGLLALTILKDYGNAYNACITLGMGISFQSTLLFIPFREDPETKQLTFYGKSLNFEKDKLVKYAAVYYICMTQLFINLKDTRKLQIGTYASFNFLLGALTVTLVDTILHWKLKDTRIPDPTQDTLPINVLEEEEAILPAIRNLPAYNTTIRVIPINKNRPGAKQRENVLRVGFEIGKFVLAASIVGGLWAAKAYAPNSKTAKFAAVPLKFANIFLGHAIGGLTHEVIHGIHEYVKKKYPPQTQNQGAYGNPEVYTPTPLKVMMTIEKTERVLGILLPGVIIAFYSYSSGKIFSAPDIFAGVFMGMLRQIDFIHFTQTPADRLNLGNRQEPMHKVAERISCVAKWSFAVFAVGGFLGYGIYQGIAQGQAINAYALGTVAALLYPSYFLAKWIGNRKIDQNSHPFLNSLYFFTNYSIAAPIIYIAVTQVLKIGDIALDTYGIAKTLIACIGWGSLAWTFGVQAGSRDNLSYPANVDPLIILFTAFFVKQLIGKAPS